MKDVRVQKIQSLTTNIAAVDRFRRFRLSQQILELYTDMIVGNYPYHATFRETAAVMQEFTQSGGLRSFGVYLLVTGCDDNSPQLMMA
ncbi:proteasome subunit alpha type-2-like [Papaver somniferum]|uniref:proteasome subunit alpha type-2-like n=1 Tax=Papaver somniferum TaxID=3469 RepID=UPI000E70484B|nr:proteasome subunit alpha type-2-like [Papaver somniferum]